MSEKRPFLSTSIFAAVGRIGGIIIPFVLASIYGAGKATDAFFMAFALVVAFSSFIAPIFDSVLLPMLSKYRASPESIFRLTNGALLLSIPAVSIFVLLVAWGIMPCLERWSGLDRQSAQWTGQFFLEMMPFLIFGIMMTANNSVFYVQKRFWFPALSPLIRSFWVICFILIFFKSMGLHAASYGYATGEICRWLVGIIFLTKLSLWKRGSGDKEVRKDILKFFKQASIQLPAFFAINLIPISDQWFASFAGVSGVSIFSYSERLFQIPYMLFTASIIQIFYSDWSEGYLHEDKSDLWNRMKRDLVKVLVICLTISIVLFFFRDSAIRWVFGWGKLNEDQMIALSNLSGWFLVAFTPGVIHILYTRILYIMQKSTIFFWQGWLKLGMNLVFNGLFMKWFGLVGIVISTALVYTLTAIALHLYVSRNIRKEINEANAL